MVYIITSKTRKWNVRKDDLHKRRKELSESMKDGLMSTSQMKKGTDGLMSHEQQVSNYDKWKEKNQGNMNEWHGINKEFKEHGEEGRPHTIDNIRDGKITYD